MNVSSMLGGCPGRSPCPECPYPDALETPFQPLVPLNLAVTVTFAEKTAPKPPLGSF
jgi:hypothetical protein